MAKDAYYFSHDSNARNDPKCSALIAEYGMEGYGLFWVLVEIFSEQENYKLEKFPKLYEAIAKQCSSTAEATRSTIEALINDFNLLCEDEKYIWSISLLRRMEEKENKRQVKVEAGRQGGLKSGFVRNQGKQNEAQPKQNEAVLEANEPKESKVKERKVKNIYISDCEYLWNLYPEKDGKISAMKKLPKLIEKYGKDQMERTIKRYIESVDQRRAKGFPDLKYKNGSTFFNDGYGDYLDENQQSDEKPLESFKPTWVYREL